MPQISKYPLDAETERQIFQKFWRSLSALRDAEGVSSFFSDFLTDTERLMLVKRFAIAVLLLKGKRPQEIKRTLHVSNSATGPVASWLKNATPKTLATLNRVIKEGKWEELFDRIEDILDGLPPRYGTNWSQAGKEEWQRKLDRASRKSIR